MAKKVRAASAIRYDERTPAPFVLASGRGERADRLLEVARRYGVPVQDAPELAERLVHLEPGEVIPEELFLPVARILAFVLDLDDQRVKKKNERI